MTKNTNIKLYSYYRSSAAYRVRIALHHKKIPYEYIGVNLIKNGGEQLSDEYKKINSLSQVPCLIHNGKAISQSMAIIQYLDDICPSPELFPHDDFEKALVMQICEIINSGIQPLQNLSVTNVLCTDYGFKEEEKNKWIIYWNNKGLAAIENLLAQTSAKFCVGEKLSAADCFLVPQVFSAKRFGVDLSAYPNVLRVNEHASNLEEVQLASPEKQIDSTT